MSDPMTLGRSARARAPHPLLRACALRGLTAATAATALSFSPAASAATGVAGATAESEWSALCGALLTGTVPDGFWVRRAFSTKVEEGRGTVYTICVDSAGPAQLMSPSTWNTDRNPMAHQAIQLLIRRDSGDQLRVESAGQRGVWLPATETPGAGNDGAPKRRDVGGAGSDQTSELVYESVVLDAFLPGPVELSLWVNEDGAQDLLVGLRAAADYLKALAATATATAVPTKAEIEGSAKAASALADLLATAKSVDAGMKQDLLALLQPLRAGAAAPDKVQLDALNAALSPERWSLGGSDFQMVVAVERTYTGSVRVGVSALYGAVASQSYEVAPAPDNADISVVRHTGSAWDAEFLIGYTQLFHRRPESATGFRVGPTMALGLADINDLKVTVLSSLYVGLDFGWDNLSFAPCFVLRKVPSLRDGLEIGLPVLPATEVQQQSWEPGMALVVYPSPELWRHTK